MGKQAPYTFEFKFEPPKTKAGRKIPMLDDVYDVLKEMYEYQKENGFSPLVVDGTTGFIFINKLGNLYKHNAIDHSIRRIVNTHNAEEIKAKKEHREPSLGLIVHENRNTIRPCCDNHRIIDRFVSVTK